MVLCSMFGRDPTFAVGKLNAKKFNLKHKTMNKFKKTVLMLCLILSGALCYASGVAGTENKKVDGITIDVKEKAGYGGLDKSNTITPIINGHVLTVLFSENLGQVSVEVSLVGGGETQVESTPTPNGVIFYIPNAGSYVVTFTLSNGDVYYGEFTVDD